MTPSDDAPHLLLVEDDPELAGLLLAYLERQGFTLSHVTTGPEGVERILGEHPALVVLDLMLPGMNGLDVLRKVRADYDGAILMLTASQSEADHVAGLELGADDFVIKPLEPRILLARIRTQLRRLHRDRPIQPVEGRLSLGPLLIDEHLRDASVDGTPVPLTTMEFDVLHRLAVDAGTVVTRDDLYNDVMGTPYDGLDRGMDVYVSRIRQKLRRSGFDAARLKSVRGLGYLLAIR